MDLSTSREVALKEIELLKLRVPGMSFARWFQTEEGCRRWFDLLVIVAADVIRRPDPSALRAKL
jgi:hypothetical protein